MHTARIPPVDPAPAIITTVLAMHAGHICPSSELLFVRAWVHYLCRHGFFLLRRIWFFVAFSIWPSAWWSCTNT